MSTNDTSRKHNRATRLATPITGVVIGIAYLIAGIAGGHPGFGIFGLLLMLGLTSGLLVIRGRSETVKGLLDRRDERINQIDLNATAFSGGVLILVIIAAAIVEIARGNDAMPYAWLGAVAGLAYVGALIYQRIRQ
jgi:uncharacterized iron-regulated membrane protein